MLLLKLCKLIAENPELTRFEGSLGLPNGTVNSKGVQSAKHH